MCNTQAFDCTSRNLGHITYPLCDNTGGFSAPPLWVRTGAAPPTGAVKRPAAWGPATAACRFPQTALLLHPAHALPDIHGTRAEMGGLLAPRPLLCYPSLHPGPAAFMTTRAPSGGRRTPHTGLHPRRPLGAGPRLACPGDEPQRLAPEPHRPGAGRTRAPPALGMRSETVPLSPNSRKGSL